MENSFCNKYKFQILLEEIKQFCLRRNFSISYSSINSLIDSNTGLFISFVIETQQIHFNTQYQNVLMSLRKFGK